MADAKGKHMEHMLFDYITTYRTDYQGGELKASAPTLYHPKPTTQKAKGQPTKDIHTLTECKQSVPFNLLHKPRPILNTNPYTVQKKFEKTVDDEKLQVQKTRPRLIMSPAVSMDDIDDPIAREILVNEMYTSEMSLRLREAVSGTTPVTAPFPGLPAPANPIVLPRHQPPLVPPEWRMETVTWDNKQLRTYCEPTKVFWLARDPPECRSCDEYAVVTEHMKMMRNSKGGRH